MTMKRHKEPSYLGDGVYIKTSPHEEGAFILTTGSHVEDDADNRIYLEHKVWKKMIDYIRQYYFTEHGIYDI